MGLEDGDIYVTTFDIQPTPPSATLNNDLLISGLHLSRNWLEAGHLFAFKPGVVIYTGSLF